MSSPALPSDDVAAIDELRAVYVILSYELNKVIVGQPNVVVQLAICLFASGHALLLGVPDRAKTLIIFTLAQTRCLGFRRILVFPYFLFSGVLVSRIRQHRDSVAAVHPEVEILPVPYLGAYPRVNDTVRFRVWGAVYGAAKQNVTLL